MPNRNTYLAVTFNEDVPIGPFVFVTGFSCSLPEDLARWLGPRVTITGPGSASGVPTPVTASQVASMLAGAGQSLKSLAGTYTFTGQVVAAASFVEIPLCAIDLPANWLAVGDGFDVTLHYEIGGTTASTRQFQVALQPAADAGTGNNVIPIGQITEATATPKDGTAVWPNSVLASGIKRASVGSAYGLGINTSVGAVSAFNPATAYRLVTLIKQLDASTNSVTVYRMSINRVRGS